MKQLWNFEFKKFSKWHFKSMLPLVIIFGIGYVLLEVLLMGMSGEIDGIKVTGSNYHEIESSVRSHYEWLSNHFTEMWLLTASFCILFRYVVIVRSYFLSKQKYGEHHMADNMYAHTSAFVISLISNFLILGLIGLVVSLIGINLSEASGLIDYAAARISVFLEHNIPTLLNVKSFWLAFLVSFVFAALPGYFIHRASHTSRFFWLVTHRPHHSPEFLYPLSAPPAFAFDFLLIFPNVIMATVFAKLIYPEPLVMELTLWFLFGYSFEIFNHSQVHYNVSSNNIILRNFCRIFGDRGPYHLVHHSAFLRDQNINFGGGPFMIWDRLFGTYRKPYEELPPLGLTDNPPIKKNPFRIMYGGIAQLGYELKNNKSIKDRFKIIFGGVYYMPEHTKEYLKIED